MSRWTSYYNEVEATLPSVVMVTMVDLDIPGDRIRAHDGVGTLTWDGYSWTGVGMYGGLESVNETLDIVSQPLRLTLSGVDASLVTDAMTTAYHRQPATVYLGFLDHDTGAWKANPEVTWEGFMDVMEVEIDHGTATINLTCENELMISPGPSRYTDECQQALYPGDLGLEFMTSISGYAAKWGQRDVHGGGGGAGGGRFVPMRTVPY